MSLIFAMACSSTHIKNHDDSLASQSKSQYELLQGDWRMTGFSAFMSAEDHDKIPDFSKLNVIYSMMPSNYNLIVNKDQTMNDFDYSLPAGEYRMWANRSMINIQGSIYMYHIDKDILTLDSNYDPSIGPDGPVYYLERVKK